MTNGKKVMLRSIPARRELGTERWVEAEERRYRYPRCGQELFSGAKRCHGCDQVIDLD